MIFKRIKSRFQYQCNVLKKIDEKKEIKEDNKEKGKHII